MLKIGDITIPIVASFQGGEEAEVEEFTNLNASGKKVDNTVVQHDASVDTLTIVGFTNEELHPNSLTLSEQKEKIKKLRRRDVTDNPIDYKQYYGYLMIEDVNFTNSADSTIVNELEIVARYLPWPKYYSGQKPQV